MELCQGGGSPYAPMPWSFQFRFSRFIKKLFLIIVCYTFWMWFLLKGATVLIMIQILVLLENVNVKVRSGLTMTALKQGKNF